MSERVKGYIACVLILAALIGLVYLNIHPPRKYDFNPRADENSHGQCP